jgi:hypothetical protein
MAASLMLAAGTVAQAKDYTEGWHFEFTPYLWYAGLEGDVTVNGQKVDFEKNASDLFKAVEAGGSFRIGASYDRFVVGALVDYFSLSTDELDVEDQPAGGSLDSKMLLTEALVGYRVDGWSEGQSFVLAVGARNLHMENDLTLTGEDTKSRDNDVADGMFYVLPSVPMFASKIDGLRFNPVLGIGAGDSDLAYELFPQIQYNLNDNIAMRFGYRTVGWKFKGDNNEDNELNVKLSGLILGLGVTF